MALHSYHQTVVSRHNHTFESDFAPGLNKGKNQLASFRNIFVLTENTYTPSGNSVTDFDYLVCAEAKAHNFNPAGLNVNFMDTIRILQFQQPTIYRGNNSNGNNCYAQVRTMDRDLSVKCINTGCCELTDASDVCVVPPICKSVRYMKHLPVGRRDGTEVFVLQTVDRKHYELMLQNLNNTIKGVRKLVDLTDEAVSGGYARGGNGGIGSGVMTTLFTTDDDVKLASQVFRDQITSLVANQLKDNVLWGEIQACVRNSYSDQNITDYQIMQELLNVSTTWFDDMNWNWTLETSIVQFFKHFPDMGDAKNDLEHYLQQEVHEIKAKAGGDGKPKKVKYGYTSSETSYVHKLFEYYTGATDHMQYLAKFVNKINLKTVGRITSRRETTIKPGSEFDIMLME